MVIVFEKARKTMSNRLLRSIEELKYKKSNDIFIDTKAIIRSARNYAYRAMYQFKK